MENIIDCKDRNEFRNWLSENFNKEIECYLLLIRGKPQDDDSFYYIDAVEEAICFGWIDSTLKKIDNKSYQRFSKRVKNSNWSELNKERARRLIKLNLMTDAGKEILPDLEIKKDYFPEELEDLMLKENIYDTFIHFPELYQRIRINNLVFSKSLGKTQFDIAISNFIKNTKLNKMYGQWNDYGRLINY